MVSSRYLSVQHLHTTTFIAYGDGRPLLDFAIASSFVVVPVVFLLSFCSKMNDVLVHDEVALTKIFPKALFLEDGYQD